MYGKSIRSCGWQGTTRSFYEKFSSHFPLASTRRWFFLAHSVFLHTEHVAVFLKNSKVVPTFLAILFLVLSGVEFLLSVFFVIPNEKGLRGFRFWGTVRRRVEDPSSSESLRQRSADSGNFPASGETKNCLMVVSRVALFKFLWIQIFFLLDGRKKFCTVLLIS